jgi:hypothetical protein
MLFILKRKNEDKRRCSSLDAWKGYFLLCRFNLSTHFYKEYRNVFYLRVGSIIRILLFYLPQERTLYIGPQSKNIGGGFFLHHGFSTIIVA